jgi:hypothetical protein
MKFIMIFNHDRSECAVEDNITSESLARAAIDMKKKNGQNITCLPYDATDKDAAIREAKRIEPNYHYVGVEDALR